MNTIDLKRKIEADPDYVHLKRFEYSLEKVLERYPDGCPDKVIAAGLLISEPEVEELYQQAVAKMRMIMGVE